jgi:hypothetical protein
MILLRNLLIAVLSLGGGVALAASTKAVASYDDVAATARDLPANQLDALKWSGDRCEEISNDLFKRQCRLLAPAPGHAAQVLRVQADAGGLWVGQYDAKAKILPLEVFGCVSCGPARSDASFVVAGPATTRAKSPAKIEGEALRGPSLAKLALPFADEAAAKAFVDKTFPRLRVELLLRAPAAPNVVTAAGDRHGFWVELAGYRVWDPCDGKILAAAPASAKGPVDQSVCGKEAVVVKPVEKPAVELPEHLTVDTVKATLRPTEEQIMEACYGKYGVHGMANLNITIAGDGTIKKVVLKGKLKGTPTGDCVLEKIQAVTFPPFSDPSMTIGYPIILR